MVYELSAPSWGEEEKNAIMNVVDSGYYTMGSNVKEFEKEFARYHGVSHAVMVNSGSSANLIALACLFFKKDNPLNRGDEVIVPAISWSTTYFPLQQYGLKMRVVDVDLQTLNIDISQLEAALTPKTRMIVAVSILGNPAALDAIKDFAIANDLYLMEDNCESLDAEISGQKTGTFGDVNTFSFFFSHHISTMEGGMVITNNEELSHILKSLRAHGWTRDLPKDSQIFQANENDFYEAYRFILPGYNVRPLEFSAAIGIEQLKKLPAMTAMRRKNLDLFQQLFKDDEHFIIQQENGKSSAFSFPIILNPEKNINRKNIFNALKDENIGYRIITGGNILQHDVKRFFDYQIVGDLKNANLAHNHGFFVGNHPVDLSEEIRCLSRVLRSAVQV